MPKAELTTFVTPRCQALAQRMGLELVDVCLDRESAGKYLRIYLDKPEGLSRTTAKATTGPFSPSWSSTIMTFWKSPAPGWTAR